MPSSILTQCPLEINGKNVFNQDQAIVLFSKLNALLDLGLNSDLSIISSGKLHGYLFVLSDLIEELENIVFK